MAVSAAERADFRRAIGPGLAQLVREIAAERDLGERELGAGSSLPRILRELPDELVGEAMDIVAEADGGPVVLACMSVAAPTELAVAARVRLEEVDDLPAPGGRLTVADAWALGAEGEPVVALTVLCEREGAKGAQAFSFVLEEDVSGGAIKDGFVTGLDAGHRIVKKLAGSVPDGAELTRVAAADAHARVVAAATQGARGGWAPTDDGMEAVRIFLRAAEEPDADALVQALELAESLEGRIAAVEDLRLAHELADLVAAAEQRLRDEGFPEARLDAALEALELMGQFQIGYQLPAIGEWSGDELDEFMLGWVPRGAELDDAEAFPAAIGDVLRFIAATGGMDEQAASSLARRADQNRVAFEDAMTDPERHGPASALVAAMRADGVEIGDGEAMQDWIDAFNASSWEERDAILGPALEQSLPPSARPPKKRTARKSQKQARRRNCDR